MHSGDLKYFGVARRAIYATFSENVYPIKLAQHLMRCFQERQLRPSVLMGRSWLNGSTEARGLFLGSRSNLQDVFQKLVHDAIHGPTSPPIWSTIRCECG